MIPNPSHIIGTKPELAVKKCIVFISYKDVADNVVTVGIFQKSFSSNAYDIQQLTFK